MVSYNTKHSPKLYPPHTLNYPRFPCNEYDNNENTPTGARVFRNYSKISYFHDIAPNFTFSQKS